MVTQLGCNMCEYKAPNKQDLMHHIKKEHPDKVLECKNFKNKTCTRTESSCWFRHRTTGAEKNNILDFQQVMEGTIPPEPQMRDLLRLILQKLDALEMQTKNLI